MGTRITTLALLGFVACDQDSGQTIHNTAPELTFTSPSEW